MSHRRKNDGVTISDLNSRSATRLLALVPGVGAVYAPRIVEHRAAHGPFQSASDLAKVRGIGPRRAERVWNRLQQAAAEAAAEPPTVRPGELDEPPTVRPGEVDDAAPAGVAQIRTDHVEVRVASGTAAMPAEDEPSGRGTARALQRESPTISFDFEDGAEGFADAFDAGGDSLPDAVTFDAGAATSVRSPGRRASRLRLFATAVLSLAIGVAVTAAATHLAERDAPPASKDPFTARAEIDSLRADLHALRADRAVTEEDGRSAVERIDALEARLDDQARALEDASSRARAFDEQARKRADYLDARLGHAEDELAWKRLVFGARDALWKAKAERAARGDPAPDGDEPPASHDEP